MKLRAFVSLSLLLTLPAIAQNQAPEPVFPVEAGRGDKIRRVPVGVEGEPVNGGVDTSKRSAATELGVRYLANEGFLVEGQGRRVLVDALFGTGINGYPAVSQEIRKQLENGAGEWGDVQVALATHYHGDHFDPEAVARFLEANPEAVFVSTPQAVEKLTGQLKSSDRVRAVLPAAGAAEHLEVNGIKIEVLNLHHGRRTPPVENLGFVVTLGDKRFLHLGDTEAKLDDFEPYFDVLRDVDLALLPFWFLASDWRAEMVRDVIQPRGVVVAHMPTPDAGAGHFGRWRSYENLVDVIESAFPRARLPKVSGESYRFGDD